MSQAFWGEGRVAEVRLVLRADSFSSLHPCPTVSGTWQAVGVEWM